MAEGEGNNPVPVSLKMYVPQGVSFCWDALSLRDNHRHMFFFSLWVNNVCSWRCASQVMHITSHELLVNLQVNPLICIYLTICRAFWKRGLRIPSRFAQQIIFQRYALNALNLWTKPLHHQHWEPKLASRPFPPVWRTRTVLASSRSTSLWRRST